MPTTTAAPQFLDVLAELSKQPMSLIKIVYALLLLVVCLVVMKVFMSLLRRAMSKLKIERSLHTFLQSSVKIVLWFLTILIVAGYIGIPVGSLLAVLGVVGLAVSLAIQGTLSNLAGGVMVLVSKPFVVGDYIDCGTTSGTVADIGLVYTKLKTVDNKLIYVPNGEVSSEKIVNYTTQEKRRVDLTFAVSYAAPAEKVKQIMREVVGQHPKTLCTPEPFVRTLSLEESSVKYILRVWCATDDYWDLHFDLLEQVREQFEKQGVEFTYNHLNVHVKQCPPHGDD